MHEVRDAFGAQYSIQAELVKLRYFVGMINEQAPQVLGISLSTPNIIGIFSRLAAETNPSQTNLMFFSPEKLEFWLWILAYLDEELYANKRSCA